MAARQSVHIEYARVSELIERIRSVVGSISTGFDRWEESHVRGPSLYFVVVAGVRADEYADPLGENRWPVETCRFVDDDLEAFAAAAESVAFQRDGAILVSADGTIQEQMVRITGPDGGRLDGAVEYADWMGTKHLSAAEVSVREDVLAAVTLSEETGRMTVFRDGAHEDFQRDELGSPW